MLTAADRCTIQYFWEEGGDVTRWVGWAEKLPELEREHPELVWAVRELEEAKRRLSLVVRGL